jgi:hypothetical protein
MAGGVQVGVTLAPERAHAVAVRGREIVFTWSVTGATPESVLTRVAQACPDPAGVVVDISRLLLDRVLSQPHKLSPVTVIRIVPRPATDPALGRHPAEVIERLVARRITIGGGHDLFGRELRPLDLTQLRAACTEIQAPDIAVVAAGSPAQPAHEQAVANALQAALPDARISLSYEFGGHGLVAREATMVLNAALAAAAGEILDACQSVNLPFHVARGDGGWVSAARLRVLPVVGLGAVDALRLLGAAALAGVKDCRVLLERAPTPVVGDVRHGLVRVRSQAPSELGTLLVVPTAVLARADFAPAGMVVRARRDIDELACVGAAVSRPTAWLDEIAFIDSTAKLEGIRRDALARATAIATANGAAPGTADVVEMATVALPYSPAGTVRLSVRVAGRPGES